METKDFVEQLDLNKDSQVGKEDVKILWEFLNKENPKYNNEFVEKLEKDLKFKEVLFALEPSFLDVINSKDFLISPENKENIIILQFFAKYFRWKNISINWEFTNEIETIYLGIKNTNQNISELRNLKSKKSNKDLFWELNIEVSQEDLEKIEKLAQKELWSFVKKKANSLTDNRKMLLWPTMDLSMAFIIWDSQNSEKFWKVKNLAYWNKEEWWAYKSYLKEQWFPIMSPQEMKKISKIWYFSRIEWNPEGKWVAKHFPWWDESLLLTHTWLVKFQAWNEYVKSSLSLFSEIIKDEKAPKWIMISHASYDISYFPWIEKVINRDNWKYPYLNGIPFDEIPASLNPYLNSYLKETLWYKWLIIPDWFWWMKAYTIITK